MRETGVDLYDYISTFLLNEKSGALMRLSIVYIHLIACCVAIGLVFTCDAALIRDSLRVGQGIQHDNAGFHALTATVGWSLAVLWLTGAAIIFQDALKSGFAYFHNPKLQVKITIVVLLTMNGALLHRAVLPAIAEVRTLLKLSPGRRRLAVFAGTVSAVSWFYAALLRVGRPLAWEYSFLQLTAPYLLLIAGGCLMMMLLLKIADWRRNSASLWSPQVPR